MIIDMHMHPFCKDITVKPSLEAAVQGMVQDDLSGRRREKIESELLPLFTRKSVADIIKDMDEAGVDKACIVSMDLSTWYGVVLVTNEDLARLTSAYPDRFIAFAGVDPNQGRPAVDELVHAVRDLGCRGLKLVPPVQHFDISDPKYDPLWEAAQDLGIILWTHCSHQMSHPDSDARLGHPMLLEPLAHKFRRLKIVLGHCGFPWVWDAWSLVVRHPNVYLDISFYTQLYKYFPWDAFSAYHAEDKILFATDYPLMGLGQTLDALEAVDISPAFKEKIRGGNAAALLGLV